MKKVFNFLLMIILFSGCERIETGKPFDCSTGKRYRVDNTLSFSIDSLKDYRCPKDVECIWSGDVDLYFSIQHNMASTDTVIYFITRGNNPFRFAGYTFKIQEVNPHLKQGEQAREEDYRIKMLITED